MIPDVTFGLDITSGPEVRKSGMFSKSIWSGFRRFSFQDARLFVKIKKLDLLEVFFGLDVTSAPEIRKYGICSKSRPSGSWKFSFQEARLFTNLIVASTGSHFKSRDHFRSGSPKDQNIFKIQTVRIPDVFPSGRRCFHRFKSDVKKFLKCPKFFLCHFFVGDH